MYQGAVYGATRDFNARNADNLSRSRSYLFDPM
jgi:hypothetical protein